MCFVSLPVSRVRELPRRRRRHPRRAALTAAAFIYIYITYMQTQHTATHSCIYSTHNCICVCAYLRLCKTRSDMYTIVLPFQLYTNTNKKWEWYTIATSAVCACECRGMYVCARALACVSIPENTMTNEIKFKQKQTQMK